MISSPLSQRSRPPMTLSRVVLPEPLGPRIATNSLSRRFRLTPSRAFCTREPVLYTFRISLIWSMTHAPFLLSALYTETAPEKRGREFFL